MHYSGLSLNFRPVPTHLGSLELIIYIIENNKTNKGTEFCLSGVDFCNIVKFGKWLGLGYSIPISIAHFCCVFKLTDKASTFPPNPYVGSLFLYWDRGGTLSNMPWQGTINVSSVELGCSVNGEANEAGE